ncbi:YkvI family membrane protein [Brevibacillus sp. NRS-1366]|uniref:YkvI family membrane protein n=1 Tax=Brevibacillus sp. NRS-1366 TaxID=3233899 RepID=UPI003D1EDFCE
MVKEIKWTKILNYIGAILAFCIGAGFATGQEITQFFVSYGYLGFAGILISLVLYLYMCSSFMYVGKTSTFKQANDVFKYYCGNVIGTFFEWYSIILLFLIFIVMLSGAGAVFDEYYGLPTYLGRLFLAITAVITVIFGFKRMLTIIGFIGPIIVVGCLVISVFAFITNIDGFSTANTVVANTNIAKASGSWWLSGILYASFMSILLAAFLAAMGETSTSKREAIIGGALGGGAFSIAVAIVAFGLFVNIEKIYNKSIPLLYLANELIPIIGAIFAIILLAGIYTTAAPILWSVCIRFTKDKSQEMIMLAIALTTISFFISFTPFEMLVNIIYPSSGWLGIVFLLCMIFKQVKSRANRLDKYNSKNKDYSVNNHNVNRS